MSRETARYSVIVGFIERFKGLGEILDVGCGQGFLFHQFRPYGYTHYVGIDISDAAIARLGNFEDEKTQFVQANADDYLPTRRYDVIVFNESLYYLENPIGSLRRYAECLKPEGVLIVSNYTASRRARALLSDTVRAFHVKDQAETKQGGTTWKCIVVHGPAG